MHAEGVPPIESIKSGQERDDTAPESPERRKLIKAIGRFFVGGAAAVAGLGTDDAEAGRRKNPKQEIKKKERPREEKPKEKKEYNLRIPETYEAERDRYISELQKVPLRPVHRIKQVPTPLKEYLGDTLPLPDPYKLFGGDGTGAVVIPTFHQVLLFKEGELVSFGDIPELGDDVPGFAGTAGVHKGGQYETPRGFFRVGWQVPGAHTSSIYDSEGPNMFDSTHLLGVGSDGEIAIHGSRNIFKDPKTGKLMFNPDSSHGCINMYTPHAGVVLKTLKPGDPVVILGDIYAVERRSPGTPDIVVDRDALPGRPVSDEDLRPKLPAPKAAKQEPKPKKPRGVDMLPGEPTGL